MRIGWLLAEQAEVPEGLGLSVRHGAFWCILEPCRLSRDLSVRA